LLAASLSGLPLMPAYTELFMAKGVTYIKSYFPIFLLGAVFGKIMEDTGLAKSISRAIISSLGKERAILSVVLAGAVLTYGGVSLFVVVFAVYPFAAALFREADIPKRLVPGSVALGAFTFTMDSFPGTPQIQNIIPTNYNDLRRTNLWYIRRPNHTDSGSHLDGAPQESSRCCRRRLWKTYLE